MNKLREALGDSAETPRFIETLARRGYRFVGKIESQAPAIRALAVLPLENLSHDPKQEFFAEGLTEALITTLAKIGALAPLGRELRARFARCSDLTVRNGPGHRAAGASQTGAAGAGGA